MEKISIWRDSQLYSLTHITNYQKQDDIREAQSHGRSRHRLEKDLKEAGSDCVGLDTIHSGEDLIVGFYEHRNHFFSSVNSKRFFFIR